MFAGNLVGLGLLVVCFLPVYKTNPNRRKVIYRGKKVTQNATFTLFFLGLGWPWVGEFVGFIIILRCFPTQQNLVYNIANTQGQFEGLGTRWDQIGVRSGCPMGNRVIDGKKQAASQKRVSRLCMCLDRVLRNAPTCLRIQIQCDPDFSRTSSICDSSWH